MVQGAVLPQLPQLPQLSLRGLGGLSGLGGQFAAVMPQKGNHFTVNALPLACIEWVDVTWVSRRGIRLVCEGHADFDAGLRPRSATLRRPRVSPPAEVTLARQGQEDRWEVRSAVGGGTAPGAGVKPHFAMGPSVLLRFGMDKAIRSVGKDYAGITPLDGISGQIDTQNTP